MSYSEVERDRVSQLIHILLIDDDPIFRLGLRTALEAFPDLQVVAEADTSAAALEILGAQEREYTIDLVVLELGLGRSNPTEELNVESSNPPLQGTLPEQPSTPLLSGLSLCQQLKAEYPNLPILLLTAESEPLLLMSAKEFGVEGYCAKGCAVVQIVQAMRQLMLGQSYWQTLVKEPPGLVNSVRSPSWHSQLRSYGLRQIEDTLAQVTQQLENPKLSNLDWLFWSGRRRELLAARWVVNQLLPTDVIVVERETTRRRNREAGRRGENSSLASSSQSPMPMGQVLPPSIPLPTSQLSRMPHQATLFDLTLAKLQSGLSNLTGVVLEIDILQAEKKRDLLYIVLHKFEEILDELRFSQVMLEQLPQKRALLRQDLWQVSVTEFFGKYYTLQVGNQDVEVVNILLDDAVIVQTAILDKIPFVTELLSHQLFETPLMIDNVSYPAHTPEAIAQAELILENLLIQVANAVIQPLLNRFSDIEKIKQDFYDRRLISSRDIVRFRNNLSWRYRLSKLLNEPRAIFESRYDVFVLSDTGIKQTSIYAPRRQELEQLRGIQLAVTLAYETRDAIAPRLRTTFAWVGRGVVYILTQVLGRSIGLVVRGVIQGIGNTLQDTRFGKNSQRGK
jgi:DNA-binding NarL/FixJ family response regulator